MRPSLWIICVPLVLLAGCAAGLAQPGAARDASTDSIGSVQGYGETIDAAHERALEKASDRVERYLDEHYPDIGWRPTIQRLLKEGVVKVDGPQRRDIAEKEAYEVTAHFDMTKLGKLQPDVDQAREQSQANALYWRHLLLGRILAAFVALFLIVGGYLRLEELTRGYYTTLLRVGAGAVLLLIAALVLLVRI